MSVLPDVLVPGLAVVFCGSAVGAASARRRGYYAGPGNAFWRTLYEVGFSVTDYGLGLTDVAKNISGSDRVLSREHFDVDGLRAKIRALPLIERKRQLREVLRGRPIRRADAKNQKRICYLQHVETEGVIALTVTDVEITVRMPEVPETGVYRVERKRRLH